MTTRTTRIIAIEGIDASGKTTQTDLLAERLRAEGRSVEVRSFPRYDSFFGQRIFALLDGAQAANAGTTDPRSMALWFAMDRWQSFAEAPATDVLLLNRYTLSNAVYQASRVGGAEGDAIFEWILHLEHGVLGLPRPDLTIVLDVDVDTATTRARSRAEGRGSAPDVYERSPGLLVASRQRYASAGALVEHLHVVPVSGRLAAAVAGDVWALVG